MIESMVGSIRRKFFRFFWYRAAAVRVVVLCTCGLAVGELLGDDSGCGWGLGGDIGAVFGRLEVALAAKRDLLEDFIVDVRKRVRESGPPEGLRSLSQ